MTRLAHITFAAIMVLLAHRARSQDSLVFLRDIRFISPFEREAFYNYTVRRENDAFSLLIADGSLLTDDQVSSARKTFYALLDEMNTPKFQSKTQELRTKTVAKALFSKYFKKYLANSRFEELIHRGEYSEVSGSGLYSLALDYLRIPYNIQEAPNNVFVLACPGSKQIMLESTIISLVMTSYDQTFKKNFIESLRMQKLISDEEFAKSTVNALFDRYYMKSADLFTLQALAGLQYYQHGVVHMEQQNTLNAFQCFEKAYYLSPTPRNGYVLMQTGLALFSELKARNYQHAVLLGKLSRYEGAGMNEEIISGEFQQTINSLLFDKGKRDDLNEYYQALLENCSKPAVKKEISFVYQFELGRYIYNDMRFNEALPFFETAMKMKPTSQPAASNFISCLNNLTRFSFQDEETLKKLEGYSISIPELNSNNVFVSMLGDCYLAHMAINFQNKKQSEGESNRKKFEVLQAAHPDINVSATNIGRAYSDASVYYFKKGQSAKAKECINAGLKISPNNYELINRQHMIR
jgi:tetratricopeptide (TPR) repeat protein